MPMRTGAAVVFTALACAACGGETDAERVEAQVEKRFGPTADAECAGGVNGRTWLCDVFVEAEQRNHEGCRAFVDGDMQVVRFTTC